MKFLIQKVSRASVSVDGKEVGSIDRGLLVFIGIGKGDNRQIADKYLAKLIGLRIFEDEQGKMNLSLEQVSGELLLISQFTLYADCRKGNRPGFSDAEAPQKASELYDYIVAKAKERVKKVEQGIFAADMQVSLVNEGPLTIDLNLE